MHQVNLATALELGPLYSSSRVATSTAAAASCGTPLECEVDNVDPPPQAIGTVQVTEAVAMVADTESGASGTRQNVKTVSARKRNSKYQLQSHRSISLPQTTAIASTLTALSEDQINPMATTEQSGDRVLSSTEFSGDRVLSQTEFSEFKKIRRVPKATRVLGGKYLDAKGFVSIWNGKVLQCEHLRMRSQCVQCGGLAICQHKKRRSVCKVCRGTQICPHNRQKSRCRDCGGASICEHNREKSRCKECGGSQICEHQIQKAKCKVCGSVSFCKHNRQRNRCKECTDLVKRNRICLHGLKEYTCPECIANIGMPENERSKPPPYPVASMVPDKVKPSPIPVAAVAPALAIPAAISASQPTIAVVPASATDICSHGNHRATCKDCKESDMTRGFAETLVMFRKGRRSSKF